MTITQPTDDTSEHPPPDDPPSRVVRIVAWTLRIGEWFRLTFSRTESEQWGRVV